MAYFCHKGQWNNFIAKTDLKHLSVVSLKAVSHSDIKQIRELPLTEVWPISHANVLRL